MNKHNKIALQSIGTIIFTTYFNEVRKYNLSLSKITFDIILIIILQYFKTYC